MKNFSFLFFLLMSSTGFFGCQKKSDPPTKTDHISSAPWMHESSGVDGDRNGTIDFTFAATGTVPPCRLDNILTFKKDNTGITDEGALKCNTSDPQTSNFGWGFADSETALNINGNVFPVLNGKFKIMALTATSFSLSRDTVINSQNVAVIVNLKH